VVWCPAVRLGQTGVDFEAASFTARERSNGGNPSARDEDRPCETGLDRRDDQAAACVAQPLQAAKGSDDLLERADPVAQTGGVLEPTAVGKVTQTRA